MKSQPLLYKISERTITTSSFYLYTVFLFYFIIYLIAERLAYVFWKDHHALWFLLNNRTNQNLMNWRHFLLLDWLYNKTLHPMLLYFKAYLILCSSICKVFFNVRFFEIINPILCVRLMDSKAETLNAPNRQKLYISSGTLGQRPKKFPT